MATIPYKYVTLNEPDVSANQSRGISYQFNGYALMTVKNQSYLRDLLEPAGGLSPDFVMPSISDILRDGDGVLLFRDQSYICVNQYPTPNSIDYQSALKNPGSHMFLGISAMGADEFSVKDDSGVARGTLSIEIPIYDSMMGDRLSDQVRVDAVVLYGQAYNRDFYSEFQQGQIENSVPIGMIVFTDSDGNQRPRVNPKSESKGKVLLRASLSLSVEDIDSVVSGDSYDLWSKFGASMHVVNNDLLTTSSFVIHGRDVIPSSGDIYDEDPYGSLLPDQTVDFNSRVFFTNDVPGSDYDKNVHFGSPARLTILNRDVAVNGDRSPQQVLGKVKYWEDSRGYEHAYLDGIHQSYFTASGFNAKKGHRTPTSGSVYEEDWFSKEKPGISLFSYDTDYHFEDEAYGSSSAVFANGNNLFSDHSLAVGNSTNINSTLIWSRGKALVVNSHRCTVFGDDEKGEDRGAYKVDSFLANSQDVNINTVRDGKKTNALSSVINSNYISINANGRAGEEIPELKLSEQCRAAIIGCNRLAVRNSDNNTVINVKGWSEFNPNYPTSPARQHWSNVENTKNSTFIGGTIESNHGDNVVVVGTRGGESDASNRIDGRFVDGVKYEVRDSVVIGNNNTISVADYPNSDYHDERFIFAVGKGLKNDIRQTMGQPTGAILPTLLIGSNNQRYYQDRMTKQIVHGGYHPHSTDIPRFSYNSMELAVTWGRPQKLTGTDVQYWNKETIMTLTDVKGRSVDYGSEAINLGYIKGRRSDVTYGNYQFKGLGRINLYKLYQLLRRLYWCEDGVVRYHAGTRMENQSVQPWSDYDRWGGTVLANLIDDQLCQFSFSPEKPRNY